MKGYVKSVRFDKGYGFVIPDGSDRELFFHVSALSPELDFDETLLQRTVAFDEITRDGRPRAVFVRSPD